VGGQKNPGVTFFDDPLRRLSADEFDGYVSAVPGEEEESIRRYLGKTDKVLEDIEGRGGPIECAIEVVARCLAFGASYRQKIQGYRV